MLITNCKYNENKKKQRLLIKKIKESNILLSNYQFAYLYDLLFNGFHKDLEIQFLHVIGDDH